MHNPKYWERTLKKNQQIHGSVASKFDRQKKFYAAPSKASVAVGRVTKRTSNLWNWGLIKLTEWCVLGFLLFSYSVGKQLDVTWFVRICDMIYSYARHHILSHANLIDVAFITP